MTMRCLTLLLIATLAACAGSKSLPKNMNGKNADELLNILMQDESLNTYLNNKDSLHLQIIYTRIDRDKHNRPTFTDYTFNVDDTHYFYPASTVKMPVALLALEKINALRETGIDRETIMVTDSSFAGQQPVYNHANAADGIPSVANYIKEIFLVSDNDAFNRLYEFLGQEYINKTLHEKGYQSAEIIHRLNIFLSEMQNRNTNGVTFFDTAGKVRYQHPMQHSNFAYASRKNLLGNGYFKGASLVNEPFDFSKKNRFSLTDLHKVLRAIMFPNHVGSKHRFNIKPEDYAFLYKYMSAWPGESQYPNYESSEYQDAYAKFLLLGAAKGKQNGKIRIFNKVGDAYGFLTDVAYIIDVENKVEFMLSATLLCNRDGIFNDDKYDYNTIGFPFMKKLGEVIYAHDKARPRKYKADLSAFMIDYSR